MTTDFRHDPFFESPRGGNQLGAPSAITGGIAKAVMATAFGLGVAIFSLLPFNYLNARLEEARHEIQDAAPHSRFSPDISYFG